MLLIGTLSSFVWFLLLVYSSEFPKYRIENRTSLSLLVQQRGEQRQETVPPNQILDYAWDRYEIRESLISSFPHSFM